VISSKQWIILFGGAGREACVERMIAEGVDVQAILVPVRRADKLESSIAKLKLLHPAVIEVEKTEVASALERFSGKALLSIGFPYLLSGTLLGLFQPAINLHPTLLPRYRGPTTGAYILLNDERESGSTMHFMTEQMDKGGIILQSRVDLSPFDTIRSLQRKVYAVEPELVIDALGRLENGAEVLPQDETKASEFPKKRTPADSELDPTRSLIDLVNHIRACDPTEFPAFFMYHGQRVNVFIQRSSSTDADDEV
jgi:methionyl-tRNA formyltransferase